MQVDVGTYCPLLKKSCVKLECAWFTKLTGTSKNTGQPVDEWGCAVAWLPLLLIENAGETRQAAAAVESLRNATVRSEDATRQVLMTGIAQMSLFDDPKLIGDQSNGGS